MKADISTLHKPDILILRRQKSLPPLKSKSLCATLPRLEALANSQPDLAQFF